MRIGVGNRILRNHQYFVESGQAIVSELEGKSYLKPDSHVLELGCGCGRNAIALARFLAERGSYVGQDVDLQMIKWCQGHLQNQRVQFHHADLFSKVYNPNGQPIADYSFPAENDSITLIISVSVFSHLLDGDFARYVQQSSRVLSRGSHLHMTLFLLDYLIPRLGDRWTFSH
jgi:cyclopropane fatty-acyl-phospholipid synthase-like methyltransferase